MNSDPLGTVVFLNLSGFHYCVFFLLSGFQHACLVREKNDLKEKERCTLINADEWESGRLKELRLKNQEPAHCEPVKPDIVTGQNMRYGEGSASVLRPLTVSEIQSQTVKEPILTARIICAPCSAVFRHWF